MKNILYVLGVCAVVSLVGLVNAPSNAASAVSQSRPSAVRAQWIAQVRTHIAQSIRYPPGARRRGQTGDVWVTFLLNRQGKVFASRVKKSSGHKSLDLGALQILKGASPFPPPPATVEGRVFQFDIPLIFGLEGPAPDLSGEWQPPMYPSSGSFQ